MVEHPDVSILMTRQLSILLWSVESCDVAQLIVKTENEPFEQRVSARQLLWRLTSTCAIVISLYIAQRFSEQFSSSAEFDTLSQPMREQKASGRAQELQNKYTRN